MRESNGRAFGTESPSTVSFQAQQGWECLQESFLWDPFSVVPPTERSEEGVALKAAPNPHFP